MSSAVATFLKKTAWEECGEPTLTRVGLYTPTDRTYGRSSIPFSAMEKRLYESDDVEVYFGKAMLDNNVDWSWYQVWENKEAQIALGGRRGDIIFVHGTGVHSGTLASHSRRYLDAGYRLIVPDLISHGYSSGLHVYQRHMSRYTEGLHAVLHDVARRDRISSSSSLKSLRKQTFMLGLSFGGTVALHYALDYPHSLRNDPMGQEEIPIDGIICVGPILGYSAANVSISPSAAKFLGFVEKYIGGSRIELTVPHKKSLDKDPKVYNSLINEDKRSHQGAFRIGHLACINEAVTRLQSRANEIRHSILIQHGGQDRVAAPDKTLQFIQQAKSDDKRMIIYPVCQHVIFRKPKSEEEDMAGRVVCIDDSLAWMNERSEVEEYSSTNLHINIDDSFSSSSLSSSSSSSSSDRASDCSTPCPSEYSFSFASPNMTEETPPATPPHSPLESSSSLLQSLYVRLKAEREENGLYFVPAKVGLEDHPLLANAHRSTLPMLAKISPMRSYRPRWTMSESLQPFDIPVHPQASDQKGEKQDFSTYSA